jgi:hypothetical protein
MAFDCDGFHAYLARTCHLSIFVASLLVPWLRLLPSISRGRGLSPSISKRCRRCPSPSFSYGHICLSRWLEPSSDAVVRSLPSSSCFSFMVVPAAEVPDNSALPPYPPLSWSSARMACSFAAFRLLVTKKPATSDPMTATDTPTATPTIAPIDMPSSSGIVAAVWRSASSVVVGSSAGAPVEDVCSISVLLANVVLAVTVPTSSSKIVGSTTSGSRDQLPLLDGHVGGIFVGLYAPSSVLAGLTVLKTSFRFS